MVQIYAKVDENQGDKLNFYIYGDIVPECWRWYDDEVSAVSFLNKIRESNFNSIDVFINSGGGSVFEALAIYSELKRFKGKVTTFIDGIAASAASVIALAGDEVVMYKHSLLMIHNAWTSACGNAEELKKAAEDLEKVNASIREIYMQKFNQDEERLKDLMQKESFLTASDCVAYGFINKVIEEDNAFSVQNSIISKSMSGSFKPENKEPAIDEGLIISIVENILNKKNQIIEENKEKPKNRFSNRREK